MIPYQALVEGLRTGAFCAELGAVYAADAPNQGQRLLRAAQLFADFFATDSAVELFSAPGRSEIAGNHTDHNCGKVLAAGVNLDAVAVAAKRPDLRAVVKSEGHELDDVVISDLTPVPEEIGRSAALLRGVCAGFVERGYAIGGFEAATLSDVLSGSGLSSSAAFEVLVGTILNYFYNDGKIPPLAIAQIAQYAENRFFGKPCGLMDQTACAVGGFVGIDFADTASPVIRRIDFDFAACGHALCITDSGGSHADLTEDYALVRREMEAVAAALGKRVLRETDRAAVLAALPALRESVGDRAVLRALHFFAENERVDALTAALAAGDFAAFCTLIKASGRSSFMYNQNVYNGRPANSQPVSLALALSETLLGEQGAWRVHGGGFAGTVQAFVPLERLDDYCAGMEAVFGQGSCRVLRVRPQGGVRLLK
ncbi:MAG: galactokinase [Oscillospiraceae bacterium]|jgi:galactokinase|nr:galactokinase [Oscillospiraceae bacterium]